MSVEPSGSLPQHPSLLQSKIVFNISMNPLQDIGAPADSVGAVLEPKIYGIPQSVIGVIFPTGRIDDCIEFA